MLSTQQHPNPKVKRPVKKSWGWQVGRSVSVHLRHAPARHTLDIMPKAERGCAEKNSNGFIVSLRERAAPPQRSPHRNTHTHTHTCSHKPTLTHTHTHTHIHTQDVGASVVRRNDAKETETTAQEEDKVVVVVVVVGVNGCQTSRDNHMSLPSS